MAKHLITGIMMIVLLFSVGIAAWANPWVVMMGEEIIQEATTIEGDLFFNGERLEIDGTVNGDLILLSGDVIITGRVEGDVIGVVWQTLKIDGNVGGHLRVLAREIKLQGTVEKTVTTGAFYMTTETESIMNGGLLGLFSEATFAGSINGPVEIHSSVQTKLSGRISGDIKNYSGPIEWKVPLEISGKVDDYSDYGRDPAKVKGVVISGGYKLHPPNQQLENEFVKLQFIGSFIWFLGCLLLSLIFYRLFPRTAWSIAEPTALHFSRHLLLGLIALAGIPVLAFLLIFTVVGIPIAILLVLFYVILLLFAGVPVFVWMGRLLFKSRLAPNLSIILGGVAVTIINSISIINFVSIILFAVVGMGMLLGMIRPQIKEKKMDMQV